MNWYTKIASNIQLKFVYPDEQGQSKVTFDINGKAYDYLLDTDIANKVQDVAKYKPGTALDIAKKNNKNKNEDLAEEFKQAIDSTQKTIENLNAEVMFNYNLTDNEISDIEKEIFNLELVRDYNQKRLNAIV